MVDDKLPTRRLNLMEKINETLANIAIAEKRLQDAEEHLRRVSNDAKALVGTAAAELNKQRTEYLKLRQQLNSILPEVDHES